MANTEGKQPQTPALKQHVRSRVAKMRGYRFSPASFAVSAILLLVLGIGIGANTQVWNASLRALGLKPNVPALDFSSLETTYEQLAANYDGKIDTSKLIDGANHGLVNALGDPYTQYFNADEAKTFSDGLSGAFSGIGAALASKDSIVTISSVLDGSPAKAAGLLSGDQIIGIDGTSTQGWSIDKAVTAIRGTAGTSVKLTILRGDDTKEFTVTRANLTNPSVTSSIKNGVGIMTISRFGDDTTSLAQKAAASFKQANVKGVVLDVRGNGGGYVDAAQAIASLWLNDKVIVSERTGGVTTNTLHSDGAPVLEGIPTVVLIDGGSASASEIVAGALHDNKAATLIGEKSYGKGSFQSVLNLPGGNELKVTLGRWYTPAGKNIDKQGITPDVTVAPTDAQIKAGEDPALAAALSKLGA